MDGPQTGSETVMQQSTGVIQVHNILPLSAGENLLLSEVPAEQSSQLATSLFSDGGDVILIMMNYFSMSKIVYD